MLDQRLSLSVPATVTTPIATSTDAGRTPLVVLASTTSAPPSPAAQPPTDQHRISSAVSRLFRIASRAKHEMAQQDPDLRDFAVMVVIATLVERGPQRSTGLADCMLMDPSQVSRHVATAVRAGLVERRADPDDGRATLLAVTDAGQARYVRFAEARARHLEAVVADWGPAETEQFATHLERFVTAFEQHIAHAAADSATSPRSTTSLENA